MDRKRTLLVAGAMVAVSALTALVEYSLFSKRAEVRAPAAAQVSSPSPESSAPRVSSSLKVLEIQTPSSGLYAPSKRVAGKTTPPPFEQPKVARPLFHPFSHSPRREPATASGPTAGALEPHIAVGPEETEETTEGSALRKSVWVWLGTSAHYHTLNHRLTNGTESRFHSLRAPGIDLRAGFAVEDFGLDLSYESAPGAVSSPASGIVVGETYHWQTLRAEGTWKAFPDKAWEIRAGVQQHTSPFLYPDNTAGKIFLRSLRLTNASIGIGWNPSISAKSRIEAHASYQYPVAAGTLDRAAVDLSPDFCGNASIALVHSLGAHLRLGARFQSDWQNYRFRYRDTPNSAESQGSQRLNSQSVGLQIGWEY